MSHALLSFLTLASLSVTMGRTEDRMFSGPQPGEPMTPFRVLQVVGSFAGNELQLPTDELPPTALIFVHEATRPGLQLMRPIDLYCSKLARDGLATHFIWLTSDRSKTEDWLRMARGSLNLKSPISISLDGLEGPGHYGLNRKVTLTILLANEGKVVANFAIVQPNETDAPKVLAQIARLLGRSPPALAELRAELGAGMRPDSARPAATSRRSEQAAESTKLPDDPAALVQSLEARITRLEQLVEVLVDALNESRETIAKLEGKPKPEPIQKR